jgi:hypothetical protein
VEQLVVSGTQVLVEVLAARGLAVVVALGLLVELENLAIFLELYTGLAVAAVALATRKVLDQAGAEVAAVVVVGAQVLLVLEIQKV